ncbi:MAG: diaminopimelate epimerase [Planctomycetota bacterium]|nr:diaminopimelate epimerase [Planctomycetota bacterium]
MKLTLMAGAGNSFALWDARALGEPRDAAEVARELCERTWPGASATLDGLLVVSPGTDGAACRMTIFNADGSRPEACGNGLRCVARFAREQGFSAADAFKVQTDAGVRSVEMVREGGAITAVRASMGPPRSIEVGVTLASSKGSHRATLVDMGNPHAVLFVADERTAPVAELGRELERHPRFPKRTNVEFAALRDGRVHLRVWERGVGETAACGTGACATAVAALREGKLVLPVDIELPGGTLRVDWDGAGEVLLTGPCEVLWAGEVNLERRNVLGTTQKGAKA